MSQAPSDEIRHLVADDNLEAAVDRCVELARAAGGRLHDEAVAMAGRLRGLERRERGGEERDRINAERAALRAAVLGFATDLSRRGSSVAPRYVSQVDVGHPHIQLEKLYGQATLRHLAWLRQGLAASRAVGRIVTPSWKGTGFIINGNWLITNWHVLPDAQVTGDAELELNYEEDIDGRILPTERYRLDPTSHFADETLDCARVKVIDRSSSPLATWGQLSFERALPIRVGDHVAIIQHPDGGPKKIAMGGNQIVNLYDYRVHYMTDTMPGSSGAPVFNDRWQVVAVHHAGGNVESSSRGDRIFANEGILAERLLQSLFGSGH